MLFRRSLMKPPLSILLAATFLLSCGKSGPKEQKEETALTTPADLDEDGYDDSVDCDDWDPKTYPNAEELPADGTDQDCDGEECCYTDHDRDGYGTSTCS